MKTETASLFEIAARSRWRFKSVIGELNVEQLWDLPLITTVATKASLNEVAIKLQEAINAVTQNSFVNSTNDRAADLLNLELDLVKYIIKTKKDEKAAAEKRQLLRQERTKLVQLQEAAADKALEKLSPSQLEARIAAINASLDE